MDELKTNVLYFGDNLEILHKYIPDNSIDMIYLDPPFSSKKDYNIIFKEATGERSEAQIKAFSDTWTWDKIAERTYYDIVQAAPPEVATLIDAMHSVLGNNDVMAYLVMMTPRLVELHRVLKDTGSLYLHCDPTASHYLKLVLDRVFGPRNFKNEIVWHYRRWTAPSKKFQRLHDIVFFYTKEDNYTFNEILIPYTEGSVERKTQGVLHRFKRGEEPVLVSDKELQAEGVLANDVFQIPFVAPSAKERLGYPTQKPLTLLERIIKASSNESDIVLDSFCGCGTALVAAHKLNRRWIGIDITHLAIRVMSKRLKDSFPGIEFEVIGEPVDSAGAKALAHQDRYQFQWWALSLIEARPLGEKKKGDDKGIDGVITFSEERPTRAKRAVVQVKSGHVHVKDIRELKDIASHSAMGVFITLEPPTREMQTEAVSAGYYNSPLWERDYPKIQILTIEELLAGKTVEMPPANLPFPKAQKIPQKEGEQLRQL
ncbi:MAG TPA: site-specific DNA-methyltransferase [Dehalococcoidia bacterium]|nr:site-specific DNA-methyltransferase [Dehalococcoidia bacterium]